jgi:hypothetical protein
MRVIGPDVRRGDKLFIKYYNEINYYWNDNYF